MEDVTLERFFKDLTEKVVDVKKDLTKQIDEVSLHLKESDERQRQQDEKVTVLQERQGIIREFIDNQRKKMFWRIGVVMPIFTAVFILITNYLLSFYK